MRQRSAPKPFSPLMPCSVYCPLRHMSQLPAAQAGQGTGSRWRTMPTIVIAASQTAVGRRFAHAAERLVAEDQPLVAVRRLAVLARDDFAIGAADAERDRLDQDRALRARAARAHRAVRTEFGVWRMDRDGAQGKALGCQPPEGNDALVREKFLHLAANYACPSTRSSRCTISARPSMPRMSRTSPEDLPRIFSASSAS